jgi:predicted ArsR family transcriptional regulator
VQIDRVVSQKPAARDRLLAFLANRGGDLSLGAMAAFDRKLRADHRKALITDLQADGLVEVYRVEPERGRPSIRVRVVESKP